MKRILVVDDETPVLQMLSRMLEREGYTVSTAECAESALRILAAEPQDVVIADVHMPGADGFDLLRAVHAMASRPPVVLMSAYPCDAAIFKSVEMMSFAYVEKPIDPPYFLSVVGRAVRTARRRAAAASEGVLEGSLRRAGSLK